MSDSDGSDPQVLASSLRPTVTRLYLVLRRRTPDHGFTAAQASALTLLFDSGPMRVGELAQHQSIRLPTASALIDGLERMGLVSRKPDPTDRRAVVVELTELGTDTLHRVGGTRDTVLSTALERLTDEERAAIAAAQPALRALRHQLEDPDAGWPQWQPHEHPTLHADDREGTR